MVTFYAFFQSISFALQKVFLVCYLFITRKGLYYFGFKKKHLQKKYPNIKKSSPPDLEHLWRDFNKRIKNFFEISKRSKLNDQTNESHHGKKQSKFSLMIFFLMAGVFWLASGVYIVHEGEVGVVLRFGRYVYTTNPGIQWRLPYPIEFNEAVNLTQVRSVEIGRKHVSYQTNLNDASMLTSDENIIDIRFAVQYRIKNASDFLFNNVDAETNVSQAAETAIREIVGKSKMHNVLYEGRKQVVIDLTQLIQRILDTYKTGIAVTSVAVHSIHPPSQVQAAFDDVVKATQDVESQIHEAYAYANKVILLTEGAATRIKEEARGYRERRVAEAKGDVSRFAAIALEYKKSPSVTRERMYIETMQELYTSVTKFFIGNSHGTNVIHLPVDQLFLNRASPVQKNLNKLPKNKDNLNNFSIDEKPAVDSLNRTAVKEKNISANPNERHYDVLNDLLGKHINYKAKKSDE